MSLPSLAVLCALVSWTGLVSGQVVSTGPCPTPPTEPNFNVQRYLGVWYEQANFFAIYQAFQECVIANYTANADGSIKVVNSGTFGALNFPISITGRATIPDPSKPGQLTVSFFGSTSDQPNYQVVETDYDNYAVVFSCRPFLGFANSQVVWILVRNRAGLSQTDLQSIYGRLSSYGIDTSKFKTTRQVGCPN